ncbi:MAG: hypothetical protein JWR24_5618 [Actinoallomurus sp.]|nr:hypothetical protein [Actinoallomurus sp.]
MRASAVAPERRRPSFMRGYAPLGWSEAGRPRPGRVPAGCGTAPRTPGVRGAVPSAGRYGLKLGNGFEG